MRAATVSELDRDGDEVERMLKRNYSAMKSVIEDIKKLRMEVRMKKCSFDVPLQESTVSTNAKSHISNCLLMIFSNNIHASLVRFVMKQIHHKQHERY